MWTESLPGWAPFGKARSGVVAGALPGPVLPAAGASGGAGGRGRRFRRARLGLVARIETDAAVVDDDADLVLARGAFGGGGIDLAAGKQFFLEDGAGDQGQRREQEEFPPRQLGNPGGDGIEGAHQRRQDAGKIVVGGAARLHVWVLSSIRGRERVYRVPAARCRFALSRWHAPAPGCWNVATLPRRRRAGMSFATACTMRGVECAGAAPGPMAVAVKRIHTKADN